MNRIFRLAQAGVLGALLMISPAALPADAGTDTLGANAQQAYAQGQWQTAADLYSQLVKRDASVANLWHLGRAELELGDAPKARDTLLQALAKDPDSIQAQLYMARALDKTGDSAGAFVYLDKAVKQGLSPTYLQNNPALAHMRADGRFTALVAEAEKLAYPCENDPKYKAFDFWVGDWDVSSSGQNIGHNLVTREMHGCLIHEHWSGGGLGESFNYYDPHSGKWRQNWVDESGGIVWYEGSPAGPGVMHMEGGYAGAEGTTGLARVTWTLNADGSVHHLIERSADGGKTWNSYFDAVYRKSPSAAAGDRQQAP